MPTDEAREVARQVESEVEERLQRYFSASSVGNEAAGYSTVGSFGDEGIVGGASDSGNAFTFVRWRWVGRHDGAIPSRIGDAEMVAPTGNPVVVEGLTAVEVTGEGDFRARWFVDWLSVYAQLGVVVQGRPAKMEHIDLRPVV